MYNINKEMQDSPQTGWTNLVEYAIINEDTDRLLYIIQMKKREQIIKDHINNFYHIWQNEKGVYLSYLPDEKQPKGRKPITAKSLDSLNDKIVKFYEKQEKSEKEKSVEKACTLRIIYDDWLKYKALKTSATSSIRRIDNDWMSYYQNDKISDIPLSALTKLDMEEWALHQVKDKNLTKTMYYNMSIIFRQALDYAVDRSIIEKNLFRDFKMDSKLFLHKQKPADETQVFLNVERPLIEAAAFADFQETGNTSALAIPLAFQLGVRLGELVALKSDDIEGNYIIIQRMVQKQERQRPDGTWYPAKWGVVPHTKTDAGFRKVYLSAEAFRIISMINSSNAEKNLYDHDYLFIDNGKRINPRAVDTRLRKYCDHIDIARKSTHKIRKTYISTLIDAGININEIRRGVGHSDERTTYKSYCFNRQTKEEYEDSMELALVI